MRLLVTGGCGFLGSHFVRRWLREYADSEIVNVDCLTYAGSLDNLEEAADDPRQHHHKIDIADIAALSELWKEHFGLVVHFAAETHVDRSHESEGEFMRTNAMGTQALLLSMLHHTTEKRRPVVIIISTDEVYGPTPEGFAFRPDQAMCPTSPYAESKSLADEAALAYAQYYKLDLTIIRSVNIYGPHQYPEKIIPLFTSRALAGETLPLYGDGRQRRCWLYVDDYITGLMQLIGNPEQRHCQPIWHLGSDAEMENREIAEILCGLCDADSSLITPVADRPRHDRRYALDFSETTRAVGWRPQTEPHDGLRKTVGWIKANREWCRRRAGWKPAFLREQ